MDGTVEYEMISSLKIDDVMDTKKPFIQCIGDNNASIGVGKRTRKMKNNPSRKARKNNTLVNSQLTERKGEKTCNRKDHLWEENQRLWQWISREGKSNMEDEKEVEGA